MEDRLNELAVRLEKCRKKGNRMSLEHVLESARILEEARKLAKEKFMHWLATSGHMDRTTAFRHLRVSAFVTTHVALMQQILTLGLSKIYALSTLPFDEARRLLTGGIRLSAPLDELTDLQFRAEFRERFPRKPKRVTRENAYRSALSLMSRAENALRQATQFAGSMSPDHRRRIEFRIRAIEQLILKWHAVAEPARSMV